METITSVVPRSVCIAITVKEVVTRRRIRILTSFLAGMTIYVLELGDVPYTPIPQRSSVPVRLE